MAGIEVPKVYHSLEYTDWSPEAEAVANGIFGEGVLDFHDSSVEGHPLMLLDEAEVLNLARAAPSAAVMGKLLTTDLVERVGSGMRPEFSHIVGARKITSVKLLQLQEPAGIKRILIAGVNHTERFFGERKAAQASIDSALGTNLPWQERYVPGIRLALVTNDDFIVSENLAELRRSLPRDVYVGGGHVEPTVLEVPQDAA